MIYYEKVEISEPFILSVRSDARHFDSEYRRDSQLPGGEPQEGPQKGGSALGRTGKSELYRTLEPTLCDCERAAAVTDRAIDKPAVNELVAVEMDGLAVENPIFINHRRFLRSCRRGRFREPDRFRQYEKKRAGRLAPAPP